MTIIIIKGGGWGAVQHYILPLGPTSLVVVLHAGYVSIHGVGDPARAISSWKGHTNCQMSLALQSSVFFWSGADGKAWPIGCI